MSLDQRCISNRSNSHSYHIAPYPSRHGHGHGPYPCLNDALRGGPFPIEEYDGNQKRTASLNSPEQHQTRPEPRQSQRTKLHQKPPSVEAYRGNMRWFRVQVNHAKREGQDTVLYSGKRSCYQRRQTDKLAERAIPFTVMHSIHHSITANSSVPFTRYTCSILASVDTTQQQCQNQPPTMHPRPQPPRPNNHPTNPTPRQQVHPHPHPRGQTAAYHTTRNSAANYETHYKGSD